MPVIRFERAGVGGSGAGGGGNCEPCTLIGAVPAYAAA